MASLSHRIAQMDVIQAEPGPRYRTASPRWMRPRRTPAALSHRIAQMNLIQAARASLSHPIGQLPTGLASQGCAMRRVPMASIR